MTDSQRAAKPDTAMSAMDVIYNRRAVRDYLLTAIAPIILGLPAGKTPPVPRKPPEIITWK